MRGVLDSVQPDSVGLCDSQSFVKGLPIVEDIAFPQEESAPLTLYVVVVDDKPKILTRV